MPTILPDIPATETAIIEMTNAYRVEQKLAPVKPSPALKAAAKAFADYLARTDTFAHDAGGTTLSQRVKQAGYDFCLISENLASARDSRGFESRQLARSTVEGWINSPGHRRNIETKGVTETAVAIARVPNQHPKYVTVQLFGRPSAMTFSVQISNSTKWPVTYRFGGRTHQVTPSMAITHTVCQATTLEFSKAGSGLTSHALSARYEATEGAVFVVSSDAKGVPTVRMEKRRKVK